MAEEPKQGISKGEPSAVETFMAIVGSDAEAQWSRPLRRVPYPSLGEVLEQFRKAHRWNAKRLALALGVSVETAQRLKGDAELPTAAQVPVLCQLLGEHPGRLLGMLRTTAQHIMRNALEEVAGTRRLIAARTWGERKAGEDVYVVRNLPLPLRRELADHLRVGVEDEDALLQGLKKLASEDPQRQARVVDGLAAGLVLDGEAPLEDEAWDG